MSHRTWVGVIPVWLVAGTLDITDALVFSAFHHVMPARVFRFIASGLTGPWALHGGMASVALGVAIHYTIALFWTLLYWTASARIPILIRRPVVCGLLYGALVYVLMTFVVLPLTRVPHGHGPTPLPSLINGILALLLCIGLTVALLTRRQRLSTGI